MKKRLLSMLLTSVLLIGVMPVRIPAAEEIPEEETTEEVEMPEEETTEMVSEDEIIGNDEEGIPDSVLYQAVLSAGDSNGDGILTKEEAAEITGLDVYRWEGLLDLTGIQYCVNLTSLRLHAEFNDISALGGVSNLKSLTLDYSVINDSSGLSELINLERLSWENSNVSDISALSSLTNLNNLELGYNNISDISALSSLVNLEYLNLEHNEISEINALSDLTKLRHLDLHHNNITDFSALSELNIGQLRIDEPVSEDEIIRNDESGIPDPVFYQEIIGSVDANDDGKLTKEEAANVSTLIIQGSAWGNTKDEITSIKGIEYFSNLHRLFLTYYNIDDISELAEFKELNELCLQGNNITDISPLSEMTNLIHLDLGQNNINDISALSNLVNLTHLELYHNNINDISALSNLTKLDGLDLNGNKVTDISALRGLTNLGFGRGLNLSYNQISDISALSELINLNTLHLSGNQISDISALSELTNLDTLYLRNNEISDISALCELVDLRVVSIAWNPISNISVLSNMVNLSWLYVDGSQISNPDVLDSLGDLYIYTLKGERPSNGYKSPTDSTENASAIIDGETIEFPVSPDPEAGCTTDKQKSAFEVIMEMIRRLIGEVGEDATKIYAPILQEYAKISVKKVWLAECIDIRKPDGVDMSQGVAVTFPAKVNKGDTVIVLHLDEEGNWERIEDAKATADGWITGTFRSLSPVFYFKVEMESADAGDGADGNGSGGSNTNDNTVNGDAANVNTANGSYDGWAGVSAEQKAKLMQESLGQKTAVVASPKTDDTNADIITSVMLLLAAALCGAALYGKKRRMKV